MLGKRKHESATCELRYSLAMPVELRQVVREVFNVQTAPGMRGKGHGSRLMEAICKEADQAHKILMLLPANSKVETWYSRFGFVVAQVEPVHLMIRNPAVMVARGKNGQRDGNTG